jgi:hypothetical protein
MTRTLVWFSGGAASAVAAKIVLKTVPDAILVRCETGNEDPDNHRFERDVENWLGRKVTLLKSNDYASVPDVWKARRYMAGISGAPCTVEMKIVPRLAFQRPTDIHVFGYTADKQDVSRFERLKANYPELTVQAPLIKYDLPKAAVFTLLERAGIALPRSYAMGFPNANCLQSGCVKATSAAYWALYRQHFPEGFAKTAALARELNVRLCRIAGKRQFIDEIPEGYPTADAIVPACDFICQMADEVFIQ